MRQDGDTDVNMGLAHWPADRSLSLPRETIGGLLRRNAERFADRPAVLLVEGDAIVALSHADLLARCENVARWLAARCAPADRVAVWSRNALEAVILQHACALCGAIIAPFNTGWSDAETAHGLALTSPSLFVAGFDNRGNDLLPRAAALHDGALAPLADIAAIAAIPSNHPLPELTQDAPFLIQFTSGTTGKAKGALLSQRAALLGGWLRTAIDGTDENDLWLNAVPYLHVGGSCAIILGALSTASAFVVLERYDRDQLVALMKRLKPTRMGGVPTMWHDILASEDLPPPGTVRAVTLGGASVPPSLVMTVRDKLGAHCVIGFGQSECTIATGTRRGDPIEEICETVGRAMPHIELRIATSDGATAKFGEVGEICVRGPTVMEGYWNDPQATAATIDADGYLHTGDLGEMDATGVVRIRGRLREVIIRGGENIYPPEVEAALLTHHAVAMVAVVGVDHERLGQEVGAVIQLRPGTSASQDDLASHTSRHVAHFKLPRHWRYVEQMPLTVSGKVRKIELAALFGPAA